MECRRLFPLSGKESLAGFKRIRLMRQTRRCRLTCKHDRLRPPELLQLERVLFPRNDALHDSIDFFSFCFSFRLFRLSFSFSSLDEFIMPVLRVFWGS